MWPLFRQVISWASPWGRYCRILIALFLFRGVVLLCVLPPFEGWDEYQHVAYAAYLVEEGHPPQLGGDSRVPPWMHAALVKYPHSHFGVEQVGIIGGLTYEQYWTQASPPSVLVEQSAIPLYQAQHPPLYYRLIAPIVRRMCPTSDLRSLIGVLRGLNLLLGAAAMALFLWAVGRLTTDGPHRYMIGLLAAVQPLFLMNCVRVANDALAVLLGSAAVVALLVSADPLAWKGRLVGGVALGASILAKTVNLGLAPFACVAAIWPASRGSRWAVRSLVALLVVLAPAVVLTYSYFSGNVSRYGMLTPMQEAVRNREAGRTWRDAVATARQIDWPDELSRRFIRRSLWAGAWSFVNVPRWMHRGHEWMFLAAAAGYFWLMWHKRRVARPLFLTYRTIALLVVLNGSMAAGLMYHMLHSKMLCGTITTNTWYAAVTFPWMLCLACQGWACYPGSRLVAIFGGMLLAILITAEWYGVFLGMIPYYTQAGSISLSIERLASLHPVWLHPAVGGAAILGGIATGVVAVGALVRSMRAAPVSQCRSSE